MYSVIIRDTLRTLFTGSTISENRGCVDAGEKSSVCGRDADTASGATIPSLCCGDPISIASLTFFRPLVR
jgi:hypothetical protein